MKKLLLLLALGYPASLIFAQNGDYMLHQRIWNTTGTFGQNMGNYAFTSLDSAKFGIGVLYQNLHSTGIQDINLSAAIRISRATLSAQVSTLGTEGYSQLTTHLTGTLPLGSSVRVGASLDYTTLQVTSYTDQNSIDASVSTAVQFTPEIRVEFLGARIFELLSDRDIWDSYIALRSMYRVSEKTSICFAVEKNKTRDMTGRLLIDYLPHPKWRILAGYQFRPNLFLLGVQFGFSDIKLGLLTTTHSQLGNNYSAKAQYVH